MDRTGFGHTALIWLFAWSHNNRQEGRIRIANRRAPFFCLPLKNGLIEESFRIQFEYAGMLQLEVCEFAA